MEKQKPNRATLIFHKRLTHFFIILCLTLSALATFDIFGSNYTIIIGSVLVVWNILRLRVIDKLLSKVKD
jgi:hypothetical protein